MARVLLDWTLADLADRASMNLRTVKPFEWSCRTLINNNPTAIRTALETEGLRLWSKIGVWCPAGEIDEKSADPEQ